MRHFDALYQVMVPYTTLHPQFHSDARHREEPRNLLRSSGPAQVQAYDLLALPLALSQKMSLSFPLRLSYKVRSSFITLFP